MKRLRIIIVTLALALTNWSCQRITLYELTTEVEFNLNLNLSIRQSIDMAIDTDVEKEFGAKVTGTMPQYMEILFMILSPTNWYSLKFYQQMEGPSILHRASTTSWHIISAQSPPKWKT